MSTTCSRPWCGPLPVASSSPPAAPPGPRRSATRPTCSGSDHRAVPRRRGARAGHPPGQGRAAGRGEPVHRRCGRTGGLYGRGCVLRVPGRAGSAAAAAGARGGGRRRGDRGGDGPAPTTQGRLTIVTEPEHTRISRDRRLWRLETRQMIMILVLLGLVNWAARRLGCGFGGSILLCAAVAFAWPFVATWWSRRRR